MPKPRRPRIDTLVKALSDNGYASIVVQTDGRIIASKSESVQPLVNGKWEPHGKGL